MITIVSDIDASLERFWIPMRPGQPIERAFPGLLENTEGGSGLTWPAHYMRWLLCWIWLKWHQCKDLRLIRNEILPIIERGISICGLEVTTGMWEEHDNWLLSAAVLSGDQDLARRAAEAVRCADVKSDKYQYYPALTGVLKHHVLGDLSKAEEQFAILSRFTPSKIFWWARPGLIKSFMAGNAKLLKQQLKRSEDIHWEIARKEKRVIKQDTDTVWLSLRKKHDHFFWPWIEGVVERLAIQSGVRITQDSFWLPLEFLSLSL
ncbi:MAG: hypothetical protein ACJ8FY_03015 [Gemmataceae bacterium]